MIEILNFVSDGIWSMPTVILIASTGLWFTLKMNFIQLTSFKDMLSVFKKSMAKDKNSDSRKPIESISTALAATVGTGSVTGVAAALAIGGPGAVFWLWVSAFFGMAVAYGEGVLSIKYRDGKKGGIMYAVRDGMGEKATATVYGGFTVLTSFGMGSMAQTNSAASALAGKFGIPPAVCGVAIAIVAALCLFSKRNFTGKACSLFIPALSIGYVLVTLSVIAVNYRRIPEAISSIFASAFGMRPVLGGMVGAGLKQAISVGFKRGVFSNEAGLGTTAAIHADSKGVSPHEQGLMNMFEVIIDTFIICTLTALCILTSGVEIMAFEGSQMVTEACRTAFGDLSGGIVAISIAGFSAATVMGWSKIGLSAYEYVASRHKIGYKVMFVFSAFIGSIMSLDIVMKISDIFNGLMIFPCMAALIFLRGEIVKAYRSSRIPQAHAPKRADCPLPLPLERSEE